MITVLRDLWGTAPLAFWLVLIAGLYYLVMAWRLTVVDIRSKLLPNRIVFPSAAIAGVLLLLASLFMLDAGAALRTVLGGAVLWAVYVVLRLVYPAGMGYGDVKLAFVLGLYLGFVGWGAVLWGTFLAFVFGALWGLALMVSRRGSRKSQIPFGPFMLAGALVMLVAG
ncbi:A24 family peptidase [Arthrobacter sp. STN4]|uniref:prepilin peptidase n=1 Tax=Arthrobacter sp. STN4 TaxID=2923276 RepID=UPI00211A754F|nr:A24 family peptidase [Arthrobacter sp. STN4]MCQ9163591.1 A24 family peptidase [Arthrobacter sp. STN4]